MEEGSYEEQMKMLEEMNKNRGKSLKKPSWEDADLIHYRTKFRKIYFKKQNKIKIKLDLNLFKTKSFLKFKIFKKFIYKDITCYFRDYNIF